MSAGIRAGSSNDGYVQVNGNDIITALSGGNVGIGNTSPSTKLHVNGTVTATTFSGNIGGTPEFSGDLTIPQWIIHAGDTDTKLGFPSANAVDIFAGGKQVRLTSDGHLGINRTTPAAPITARRLDAGGSNTAGVIAEFANSSGYGVWFGQSSASGAAWGSTTGDFYWNTGGLSSQVERLRINSTGKVTVKSNAANSVAIALLDNDSSNEIWRVGQASDGDGYVEVLEDGGTVGCKLDASGNSFTMGNFGIGVASPSGNLEIDTASSTTMIMLDVSGTNFARIGHNSSSGTAVLDVRSEGLMRFLTNGNNERLRIDSVGRHGINVTNTGDYYSASDDLIIREKDGGDSGITIRTGTANSGLICFADGASSTDDQYRRGQIRYHHNSDSMEFTTAGNLARMTINSSGSVRIDGSTSANHGLRFTPGGWNGYDNRMGYCGTSGGDFWWSSNWNPTDGARDHSGYATNFIRQNVPTGYISFGTGGVNASALERVRITSGGSVNIGDDYAQTTYKTQIETTNGNVLRLVTDSDDANGVELVLRKDSASPADGDNIGNIYFQGNDDSGAATFYSSIEAYSDDVSNNSENGYIRFRTRNDGTMDERLRIRSSGEVLIGRTTKPNDINKLVVTGTSPADTFDSQCYLEGSETSGNVNTGGALAFGGHDGSSHRNWANIYGMKENSTGGNVNSYMAFHTREHSGSPAEKLRITSNGTVQHHRGSSWASSTTNGDFTITVSDLTNNGGNNWRKCAVFVMYNGINPDATSSKSGVGYYGVGSVTTWNWFATGEDEEFTSDALNVSLDNATTTSFRLNFNVADNNTGSVTVFVNAYSTKPTITIAG